MLAVARLAQGLGSAFSWAGALAWLVGSAPPGRRGALIGTAMGSAVFGALLGPALGAAATVIGIRAAFVAVSGVGLVLCGFLAAMPGARAQPQRLSALRRVDAPLAAALWLVVLPALLFGVLTVLVPLKLHANGWSGAAIGALFFVTAALETAWNPVLGHLSDVRGRLFPLRFALARLDRGLRCPRLGERERARRRAGRGRRDRVRNLLHAGMALVSEAPSGRESRRALRSAS